MSTIRHGRPSGPARVFAFAAVTAVLTGGGVLLYGLRPAAKERTEAVTGAPAASRAPGPMSSSIRSRAPDHPRQEADFREVYALPDGVVLKRIPPPFSPARESAYRHFFPDAAGRPGAYARILNLVFKVQDGRLSRPRIAYGGGDHPPQGVALISLLEMIAGLYPPQIEGDPEVLQAEVSGDFLVRADATSEAVVAQLGAILRDECSLDVTLSLHEADCSVIVASGRFRRMRGRPVDIEISSGATPGLEARGGGSGDLTELLRWAGRFIEPNVWIANEVEEGPDSPIRWRVAYRIPETKQTRAEDREQRAVIGHLAEQTGLAFRADRRRVPIVTVRGRLRQGRPKGGRLVPP